MTSARILIVEDEQITAADLQDILEGFGHEVVGPTASGAEAIRLAAEHRPDLVLMDIRLKGVPDGTIAAREIRERYAIPCIYLTAHTDEGTLDRAKQAEPLGYIVKPFHQNELQAAIQMALHKSHKEGIARQREHHLSSTLDSIGDAVIRVDSVGRITYQNPAAEKWTGWKSSEATGAHLSEVLRLVDAEKGQPLDSFLDSTLRQNVLVEMPENLVVRSRDGIQRRVCGSVAPVRDALDHVSGAVIAFTNRPGLKQQADSSNRLVQPAAKNVVAASPAMCDLLRFAERIAASEVTTILLQGESGVGKDVLARFLHQYSGRRDKPFVAVNCAAIPETLLESELFGYEKGAFTDARSQKKGVLELADGGTVFLDEIGETQLHIQAKLLRVLEDQSFRRLGGVQEVSVNVRIIAASNLNLAEAVQSQQFRQDLYYRLNVIQIAIPPLRDRRQDIVPLAEHFIAHYNVRFKRKVEGLSPEARAALESQSWPGNIRQLRNTIERAMVLEESSMIQAERLDFGSEHDSPEKPPAAGFSPNGASLEEVERSMLVQALEKCNGNQTQAARMLGISRDTLRYRIKKFQLS